MLSGPCAVVIETRAAAGVGGAGGEEAVRACVRVMSRRNHLPGSQVRG